MRPRVALLVLLAVVEGAELDIGGCKLAKDANSNVMTLSSNCRILSEAEPEACATKSEVAALTDKINRLLMHFGLDMPAAPPTPPAVPPAPPPSPPPPATSFYDSSSGAHSVAVNGGAIDCGGASSCRASAVGLATDEEHVRGGGFARTNGARCSFLLTMDREAIYWSEGLCPQSYCVTFGGPKDKSNNAYTLVVQGRPG